ncbi:MAG: hypothetical protein LBT60_06495, partial [Oscillospiraceae bacterium]|nr:hypothetical protein [Oscillospiraceae bacterium]
LYTVVLPRAAGADVKALGRTQAAQPIADALADMGVPAQLEGRNDITVEGKKISGLAQHLKKDALCTHGSLLYDADLDTLTRVLKPDEEKIRSKAVPSLRARVTNLKPYVGLSLPDFLSALRRALFARFDMTEYACTPEDLSGIETIRRAKYANPDWTYGRAPRFDVHNQKRFPQGKAEVFLSVERGVIAACTLRGDFLSVLPIQDLERHLEGTPYRPETLTKALARPDLPLYIGGIPPEDLLTLLL